MISPSNQRMLRNRRDCFTAGPLSRYSAPSPAKSHTGGTATCSNILGELNRLARGPHTSFLPSQSLGLARHLLVDYFVGISSKPGPERLPCLTVRKYLLPVCTAVMVLSACKKLVNMNRRAIQRHIGGGNLSAGQSCSTPVDTTRPEPKATFV